MGVSQGYVSEELTHFVGRTKQTDGDRFDLLCEIIRSGLLRGGGASGTGQGNIRLDFSQALTSNGLVNPETVCFCDIPVKALDLHMDKYSRFGLAFTKVFMRRWGCNPVYYVSKNSACTDHRYPEGDPNRQVKWGDFFQIAFNDWYPTICGTDPSRLTPMQNLILWYFFGHIKFFDSALPQHDVDNYYMEREWRLIGSMSFAQADVARVILPCSYVSRFESAFPDFPIERIQVI